MRPERSFAIKSKHQEENTKKPPLISPPKRYGSRISILGVWEPGKKFEYALAKGGFKSKSEVMDGFAENLGTNWSYHYRCT